MARGYSETRLYHTQRRLARPGGPILRGISVQEPGAKLSTSIRSITRLAGSSRFIRGFVRRVARDHGVRCILYHEIAEVPSEFTDGLNVTTAPDMLRDHIEVLARDYDFVSLDEVLGGSVEARNRRPPLLLTFDDAYASVAGAAADICHEVGVPSVFFVNGAFVDNKSLALDNLATWTVNTFGIAPLASAAGRRFRVLGEFFSPYLSSISLEERLRVYDVLAEALPLPPAEMAAEASLYTTSAGLASLASKGMIVGNHTWSHVHCRQLGRESARTEIACNKRFLESIVAYPVTTFSYPYGSRFDATDGVISDLVRFGHRSAFLVESHANRRVPDAMRLSRVSAGTIAAADLFADIEVIPLLRRVRNRFR